MNIDVAPPSEFSAHLRLWQLVSPALPVGAFAYSQGLESAVHQGWVTNREQTLDWISGIMVHSHCATDIPALLRLYQAWQAHDIAQVEYWNSWLLACRGTGELRAEDGNMGKALARLLTSLEIASAADWQTRQDTSYACMFALATCHWRISVIDAAHGLLWSWCENQVSAAVKLVPLGQTDGQKMLCALSDQIPQHVVRGLAVTDDAMGYGVPGHCLASMQHETQYSRLFRS